MGLRQVAAARAARRAVARLARDDPSVFCAFVLRDERTGARIRQAPVHRTWHELCSRHDRLIFWGHVDSGKCLAPDTPVLLYDGRTTLAGDVEAGDDLLGPDGAPRRVMSTCRGTGPLYRIVPAKGAAWVCNDVHVLTLVHTVTGEVVDVGLDEYLRRSAWWKANCKLFTPPGGVDFAPRAPPAIDPYFLGLWFGDGSKELRDSARRGRAELRTVAVTKPDAEVEAACRDAAAAWGLRLRVDGRPGNPTYRIAGDAPGAPNALLDALRAEIGAADRIPDSLLLGGRAVREAFLAGLVDSDGYATRLGGVEIVQRRETYADGVCFLARSLGLGARKRPKIVKGRVYWRVHLAGDMSAVPVRIARKVPRARHAGAKDPTRVGFRVEPAGLGEYAGFTLDGDGRFLLGDMTVTHNTQQLSIGRTLWELGRNPNLRFAILSKTSALAKKIVRSIGQYVEKSDELHEVFPHLRPTKDVSLPWTSFQLTVDRTSTAKDPSVQANGAPGNILGNRIDRLVLDDVLDQLNTRTAAPRAHMMEWVEGTLFGRLAEGARVLAMGNAWHPQDVLHQLEKKDGTPFKAFRFPVLDERGRPTWPEHWTTERIEAQRRLMGPLEFARALMCRPRDDESSRFKRDWLDAARERGRGLRLVRTVDDLWNELTDDPHVYEEQLAAAAARRLGDLDAVGPLDVRTYTGVDLAVSKRASADLTSCFSVATFPNGDRRLLGLESGRWDAPEILRRIRDHHRRYASVCVVENVAAQDYLLQILRAEGAVPVLPFTTGRGPSSLEFQVEQLAVEFFNGKWVVPTGYNTLDEEREVGEWLRDMVDYDPSAHVGDRLAACCFARAGAAAGERFAPEDGGGVGARVLGVD